MHTLAPVTLTGADHELTLLGGIIIAVVGLGGDRPTKERCVFALYSVPGFILANTGAEDALGKVVAAGHIRQLLQLLQHAYRRCQRVSGESMAEKERGESERVTVAG
jgi:type IV secretory pathway TrbD component